MYNAILSTLNYVLVILITVGISKNKKIEIKIPKILSTRNVFLAQSVNLW